MKYILISLLALSFNAQAQTKRVTLSEEKIGSITAKYAASIDIDKNDTSRYVYLGFQNKDYESITDVKSVFFLIPQQNKLFIEFLNDLKKALSNMGTKANIDWRKENYTIKLYDFTDNLYLENAGKEVVGHTILSKNKVEDLIKWIEETLAKI